MGKPARPADPATPNFLAGHDPEHCQCLGCRRTRYLLRLKHVTTTLSRPRAGNGRRQGRRQRRPEP